jgi:ABC-type uncharacterized transport system auxiliary subunit
MRFLVLQPDRRPALALLLAAAALAAGCGYTVRDEYYASRAHAVPAAPGDSTRIVVAPLTPAIEAGAALANARAWRTDSGE